MTAPAPDATDEGADLARSVNTMVDSLERSQGLERQFLLSVSHDLRTPMTSIQGYAEALTDGAIADPQKAGQVILSESKRLDRLVRDLLDLARLDANKFSLTIGRYDLGQIAEDAVAGFQRDASAEDLSVTLRAGGGPLPVNVDADRLGQVLANLIENAMRYASSTVRVEVGVASDPATGTRAARATVIDDGPGIAAEDLPHVFDRLYQSKYQPQNKEAGTGVGLAIAHELVTAMGGSLRAVAVDSGAVFVLDLPLVDT
ncbi:MAG: HAMP domain-containing histidine kinase [Acidimicrobiales bacterium]|nr:HAMP domain-containing histidine kinase [Acidimicrobiales bacterium]